MDGGVFTIEGGNFHVREKSFYRTCGKYRPPEKRYDRL